MNASDCQMGRPVALWEGNWWAMLPPGPFAAVGSEETPEAAALAAVLAALAAAAAPWAPTD